MRGAGRWALSLAVAGALAAPVAAPVAADDSSRWRLVASGAQATVGPADGPERGPGVASGAGEPVSVASLQPSSTQLAEVLIEPGPPVGDPPPPAPAPTTPPPRADEPAGRLNQHWLAIVLNEVARPSVVLTVEDDFGRVFVPRDVLDELGFVLPADGYAEHLGEPYLLLDRLDVDYAIDVPVQELRIDAPAAAFQSRRVDASRSLFRDPDVSPPGVAIDYDVFANHRSGNTRVSSGVTLDAFGPLGVFTHRQLFRGGDDVDAETVRLSSTFRRDFPDSTTTLRLGDASVAGGSWGRGVGFGGIQFGTNFETRPGFVRQPLPSTQGEAVLPSTVDVLLDGVLQYRGRVEEGPFIIEDIPVLSGQGQLEIVTRDLLGRETIVRQPYQAGANVLRKGLNEYSVEAGAIREGFASRGSQYGRSFVSGFYREGLSDRFTPEIRAEWVEDQWTVGTTAALLVPRIGPLGLSVARSERDDGATGILRELNAQYQAGRVSLSGRFSWASEDFTQLGLQPGESAPRRQYQLFAGTSLWSGASVSVGYTRRDEYDPERDADVAQLGIEQGLGVHGRLSFRVLSRRDAGERSNTYLLTYGRTLGQARGPGSRTSLRLQTRRSDDATSYAAGLSRPAPLGPGLGYRLTAQGGEGRSGQGGVSVNTERAAYSVEASRSRRGSTGVRGGVRGSMLFMDGLFAAGRRLGTGFALVDVPDFPDVTIYQRNQPVRTTDSRGRALVTGLLPYHENILRIDHEDLPLDVRVDAFELDAVPYFRSGVRVTFGVHNVGPALFTLLLEDGEPVPAGTLLRLDDTGDPFTVGRRGRAYVEGITEPRRFVARINGRRCEAVVSPPSEAPAQGAIPNLGTVLCRPTQN